MDRKGFYWTPLELRKLEIHTVFQVDRSFPSYCLDQNLEERFYLSSKNNTDID